MTIRPHSHTADDLLTRYEFRQAVSSGVRAEIGHHLWFDGVCMDHVDEYFPNLEKAIAQAKADTFYWDGDHYDY